MCANTGKRKGDFIRIVADTNILISSIFWRGNPYRILRKCFEKKVKLIISKEILDEVGRILIREKKFKMDKDDVLLYTGILLDNSELVKIRKVNVIKRDITDNIILGCALAGKADYIVSGDKHLLELKEFKGIKILTAKEMMNILERRRIAG